MVFVGSLFVFPEDPRDGGARFRHLRATIGVRGVEPVGLEFDL